MAFQYRHYDEQYRERTHRKNQTVRIQFALNDIGFYEYLSILPSSAPSTNSRAMIAQEIQPIDYDFKYRNPDGRWLGFEFQGSDAIHYTIEIDINGVSYQFTIPALPVAVPAQFTPDEIVPYTMGGLTGLIYFGHLNGAYQSGGIPLPFETAFAKWVSTLTNLPHRVYRQGNQWKLQLFNPDGTEYANNTNLTGIPMVFDVRGYTR